MLARVVCIDFSNCKRGTQLDFGGFGMVIRCTNYDFGSDCPEARKDKLRGLRNNVTMRSAPATAKAPDLTLPAMARRGRATRPGLLRANKGNA
jgi:hypothetical protein